MNKKELITIKDHDGILTVEKPNEPLEKCPICKKEKKLVQIFVDGTEGGFYNFACKKCQHKQLSKKYGQKTADFLSNLDEELESK